MAWGWWLWAAWLGCGGDCDPEACAEILARADPPPPEGIDGLEPTEAPTEKPPPRPGVTSAEQVILDAVLDEIRAGVRPWPAPDAIGICRGKKDCDKFLGTEAGKLSKGAFFVKADFKVPPGPVGTWKVRFRADCTTPDGQVHTFEREYDVVNNGDERPTRLNLRPFEIPSDEGAQRCVWKLVAPDPSGDREFRGSWDALK